MCQIFLFLFLKQFRNSHGMFPLFLYPENFNILFASFLRKFNMCTFLAHFIREFFLFLSILTFFFLSAILHIEAARPPALSGSGGNVLKHTELSSAGHWSLFRSIVRFSIPLMLTGILQLAYNTADSVVVGRYAGSNSLAAVGATTSIVFLLVTLFNGVSIGANYLTARYYGAGDREAISQTVHCAAVLSVVLGLLAGVVGYFLSTPLLELAGAPEDVLPLSSLYLRIYFLGIPALVVYNFGSAILRAVGDTVFPLFFMIVSGALNVGLNLLLVIVFHLDVAGVAIATSISQLLSAVLVTIRLCTIQNICRLDLRRVRFYPDKAAQMLKIGLSAGVQGIVFSVANVMIQSAVNSFGAAVIAGNSAASGLENFIHTAQNTFYQAAITFTSQSLGARRPRQAVRVFWICMGLTVGLGVVLCGLLRIFQTPLLGIYVKSTDENYEAVMAAGAVRVLAISQFQWVGGMMETACGSIRGLGKSVNPTVTTLIGACGLRVVWLYTVFRAFGTIESLYWSYPVSWILTLAIHLVFLLIYKRQLLAPKGDPHVPSV